MEAASREDTTDCCRTCWRGTAELHNHWTQISPSMCHSPLSNAQRSYPRDSRGLLGAPRMRDVSTWGVCSHQRRRVRCVASAAASVGQNSVARALSPPRSRVCSIQYFRCARAHKRVGTSARLGTRVPIVVSHARNHQLVRLEDPNYCEHVARARNTVFADRNSISPNAAKKPNI